MVSEMQHDFRDSSRQIHLHGSKSMGSIGQGVNKAGNLLIDRLPVLDLGAWQAGGVGDGGNVQDQVGGAPEGGMKDEGIVERGFRQNGGERRIPDGHVHERKG